MDNIEALRALFVEELRPLREAVANVQVEVTALKVAGARRNGCADGTTRELSRLSGLIEGLPCSQHAQQMADLNLRVALLQREDKVHVDQDKRQEKQLDTAKTDVKEMAKYVVTTVVGLLVGYLFFKITGVTP